MPISLELLEQFAHFDARPRVEVAGRLVEQEHFGVVQQHAGDAQPLLHAARQAVDRRVGLVGEVGQRQHVVDGLLDRAAPFRL